jgi:hypothetical protein
MSSSSKVASGKDGCVYLPAFACPGKPPNPEYITKLIKKSSYATEYNPEVIKILKEIDPDEKYVVRPLLAEEVCGVPESEIQIPENINIGECSALQSAGLGFGSTPLTRNDVFVTYQKYAGNKTAADAVFEWLEKSGIVGLSPLGTYIVKNRQAPVYPPEINDIIRKIYGVHEFLIGHNLFHTDIGLNNVMLVEGGAVRFVDCGAIVIITPDQRARVLDISRENILASRLSKVPGYNPRLVGGKRRTAKRRKRHIRGIAKRTVLRRRRA